MASRVQYKFKSATTSETVIFEGAYISVADLKREIVEKKGLSKDHAAELLLSEAQTGRGTPRRALRCALCCLGLRAARPCPERPASASYARTASARTSAEWTDDSELIQKNTSVIVRRVPGQKAATLTAPAEKPEGCARSLQTRHTLRCRSRARAGRRPRSASASLLCGRRTSRGALQHACCAAHGTDRAWLAASGGRARIPRSR